MEKWFLHLSVGAGMQDYKVIEVGTKEDAEKEAYGYCYELATDFDYDNDLDYFGDLDQIGRDWDEDTQEYGDVSEMEYYAELYDPEEHDDYLR